MSTFRIHREIEPDLSRKALGGHVPFYQEQLGIKWNSKEFNIHHLNHDHRDNTLGNLVLIPSRIHKLYHLYSKQFVDSDILFEKNYIINRPCELLKDLSYLLNAKAIIHYYIDLRDEILRDRIVYDICEQSKERFASKNKMAQSKWDARKDIDDFNYSFYGLTL